MAVTLTFDPVLSRVRVDANGLGRGAEADRGVGAAGCHGHRGFEVGRQLRPAQPRGVGARLAADDDTMLYCPEGCAHGFVTLTDDAQVLLMASGEHAPDHARGARWEDPFFDIAWPLEPTVISERDGSWPRFGS